MEQQSPGVTSGLLGCTADVPAAAVCSVEFVTGSRYSNGILELDEPASWMLHGRLDRHHHSLFQRPLRIRALIGDRAVGDQKRRLMENQPHSVREIVRVGSDTRSLQLL